MISMSKHPERMSLPTVKCSTCLLPIPITKLGDHTCAPPPQLPRSSSSTEREWLPPRVASPAISVRSTASSNHPPPVPSSSPPSRLRIDTVTRVPPSPTHSTFKPSPLARHPDAVDRPTTSSPAPRQQNIHDSRQSSPLRTRMDASFLSNNPGSTQSTPSTARPPLSFSEQGPSRVRPLPPSDFNSASRQGQGVTFPSRGHHPGLDINVGPLPTNGVPFPPSPSVPSLHDTNSGPLPIPAPRRPDLSGAPATPRAVMMAAGSPHQAPVPSTRLATASLPSVRPDDIVKSGEAFIPPTERGIDTSSGGEAGMAGVGRRGFHAAARAAMFVAQLPRPMGPQPQPLYNKKQMMPQHLDLNADMRSATETPPLSAGSGYSSSHSPGPMSPLPQPDAKFPQQLQIQQQQQQRIHRSPSPRRHPTPLSNKPPAIPPLAMQQPVEIGSDAKNRTASVHGPLHFPFFDKNKAGQDSGKANQQPLSDFTKMTPITHGLNQHMRMPTSQSSGSASNSLGVSSGRGIPDPPSSAESTYSGLAYADSTDYEDDEDGLRGRAIVSPRGAPLKASILRSISNNSKVQFGSVSERSKSTDSASKVRVNAARSTLRSEVPSDSHSIRARLTDHSRDNSVSSSYSSNAESETGGRARSNSSAIAHALGLSQTPPSEYRKLGGPGLYHVGGRLARSGSGRSVNGKSHTGIDEKETEKPAIPPAKVVEVPRMIIKNGSSSAASSSSGISLTLRGRGRDEEDNNVPNLNLNLGLKSKAQRSNTVQGVVQVQSPDVKSVKLPMRAQSEREKSAAEGKGLGLPRKVKKPKVCLKCADAIENGRWVSMDGGGVLCEKCWKNMYLPKCRRCTLPIERQAVSSSDGQLKGKYHKECFNCHECHKFFPDKTFYVYDGKPLCAYHYHEANNSLCAAAGCGQPIEGPCAVSHNGDRYHPEHMTCGYPGFECGERLNEYWEVDGRMLCEQHAIYASRMGSEDEERWTVGKKAMKRVTRFIDLAGGGRINPLANNTGESGDDNDGLR